MQLVDYRVIRSIWGKNVVQGEFAPWAGASGGLITLWEDDFFEVESKIISQRYILLVGV